MIKRFDKKSTVGDRDSATLPIENVFILSICKSLGHLSRRLKKRREVIAGLTSFSFSLMFAM